MTTPISTPDPANPEAAAYALVVTAAEEATGSTAFREVLQDFCALLDAEGCASGSDLD